MNLGSSRIIKISKLEEEAPRSLELSFILVHEREEMKKLKFDHML